MILILALIAVFLFLGLFAHEFDRRTKGWLLAVITAFVILDFFRGVL